MIEENCNVVEFIANHYHKGAFQWIREGYVPVSVMIISCEGEVSRIVVTISNWE